MGNFLEMKKEEGGPHMLKEKGRNDSGFHLLGIIEKINKLHSNRKGKGGEKRCREARGNGESEC